MRKVIIGNTDDIPPEVVESLQELARVAKNQDDFQKKANGTVFSVASWKEQKEKGLRRLLLILQTGPRKPKPILGITVVLPAAAHL